MFGAEIHNLFYYFALCDNNYDGYISRSQRVTKVIPQGSMLLAFFFYLIELPLVIQLFDMVMS